MMLLSAGRPRQELPAQTPVWACQRVIPVPWVEIPNKRGSQRRLLQSERYMFMLALHPDLTLSCVCFYLLGVGHPPLIHQGERFLPPLSSLIGRYQPPILGAKVMLFMGTPR